MATPIEPRPVYGKPEEKHTFQLIGVWLFIVCGLVAIAMMIIFNPKQRALNCSASPYATITSFGGCTEE